MARPSPVAAVQATFVHAMQVAGALLLMLVLLALLMVHAAFGDDDDLWANAPDDQAPPRVGMWEAELASLRLSAALYAGVILLALLGSHFWPWWFA